MELTQKDMKYLKEKLNAVIENNLQLQCVLEQYIAHRDHPSYCDDPVYVSILQNLRKPISDNLHEIRILLDNIEVGQHA